jgi:hypothetical protein
MADAFFLFVAYLLHRAARNSEAYLPPFIAQPNYGPLP